MTANTANTRHHFQTTEGNAMNEREPTRRDQRYKESAEPAPRPEQSLKRGTTTLLAFQTFVAVLCFVAVSSLGYAGRVIPEAKAVLRLLIPNATEPIVRPGPERSTELDLTKAPLQAANEAWSIIKHVRRRLVVTSVTRSRDRNRIANPAYASTRPIESRAVRGPCAGQPLPEFRSTIGVSYSYRCQDGKWRVIEATSVASIAGTWGEAPAGRR